MAPFQETAVADRVRPIDVTDAVRGDRERLHRGSSTPAGLSRRVRAVLLMAHGRSGVEIVLRVGYPVVQVIDGGGLPHRNRIG